MTNFPTFGGGNIFPGSSSNKFQLPESLQKKKSITLMTGFLGAGKTTLINNLLPEIPENTLFIINDIGATNIDAGRIDSDNTVAMQDSCVCCGSFDELKEAIESSDAEHILIEPTGIADPQSILAYFQDTKHELSTIALVNTDSFEEYASNESTMATFQNQIRVASILATRGSPETNAKFKRWCETIGIEGTPQVSLPQTQGSIEYLPGQESTFYQDLWKQIESLRSTVSVDVEHLLEGHFHGHNETFRGMSISDEALQEYIDFLRDEGIQVLRAKGINGEGGFDYQSGVYSENLELGFSEFVIITDKALSEEQKVKMHDFMTKNTPNIPDFESSEERIQTLLEQYAQYMESYHEKEEMSQKLQGEEDSENDQDATMRAISALEIKLQKLGDEMKFDNPFIWISYKKQAYDGTPKAIPTLQSFRDHCAINDPNSRYICNKRFFFLNEYLKREYGMDLSQDSSDIHGDTSLEDILRLPAIEELSKNEAFMNEWLGYEYFERSGKTMKWEKYTPELTSK